MKFTLAAVALSLASLSAAQFSNIPSCAIPCFLGPLKSDGCKSLTDFKCHCEKTGLISKVEPCVQSKCSPSDQQAVIQDTEKLCAQYGVSLSISTPASTSSVATTKSVASYTSAPISSPATYSTTSRVYTYPAGNSTSPTSPISTPTAGAGKASFGGAVALVAAGAAMAGL